MPDGSAEHDGRDTIGGCVLLEVHLDSCTVRTTTKESRYSQIFTRNSLGKEEADYGGYRHYFCPKQGRCH